MIILGIDPGLTATGFGFIECSGNRITPLEWGVIRSKDGELSVRLGRIYAKLVEKIEKRHPDIIGVEEIFFGRNVRSALMMGHARGVALLAASQSERPVREYAATVVKQAVVGNGRASKQQVEFMVRKLLSIGETELASDASDALAVAICCFMRERTHTDNQNRSMIT